MAHGTGKNRRMSLCNYSQPRPANFSSIASWLLHKLVFALSNWHFFTLRFHLKLITLQCRAVKPFSNKTTRSAVWPCLVRGQTRVLRARHTPSTLCICNSACRMYRVQSYWANLQFHSLRAELESGNSANGSASEARKVSATIGTQYTSEHE